jgi:hypothetical protein
MHGKSIRIIGIDPGLRRTGWGVVESDGVRLSYVGSGAIQSASEDDLAYRLRELYEGLAGVIASFKPQNYVPVDAEKGATLLKLIGILEDDDDVQNVYSNFDMSDEDLAKAQA